MSTAIISGKAPTFNGKNTVSISAFTVGIREKWNKTLRENLPGIFRHNNTVKNTRPPLPRAHHPINLIARQIIAAHGLIAHEREVQFSVSEVNTMGIAVYAGFNA